MEILKAQWERKSDPIAVQPRTNLDTRPTKVVQEHVQDILSDIQNDSPVLSAKDSNPEMQPFTETKPQREIFSGRKTFEMGERLNQIIVKETGLKAETEVNAINKQITNACDAYKFLFNNIPNPNLIIKWVRILAEKRRSGENFKAGTNRWSFNEQLEISRSYLSKNGTTNNRQAVNMMSDILQTLEDVGCYVNDIEALPWLAQETKNIIDLEKYKQWQFVCHKIKNSDEMTFEEISSLAALLSEEETKYIKQKSEGMSQTKNVSRVYAEMSEQGKRISVENLITASKCSDKIESELQKIKGIPTEKEKNLLVAIAINTVSSFINQSIYIKKLPPYSKQELENAALSQVEKCIAEKTIEDSPEELDSTQLFGYIDDYLIGFSSKVIENDGRYLSPSVKGNLVLEGLLEFNSLSLKPSVSPHSFKQVLHHYIDSKAISKSPEIKVKRTLKYSDWKKAMKDFENIYYGDKPAKRKHIELKGLVQSQTDWQVNMADFGNISYSKSDQDSKEEKTNSWWESLKFWKKKRA